MTSKKNNSEPEPNYDEDWVYPVDSPDPANYTLVVQGSRGGISNNLDGMVRYIKDSHVIFEKGRFFKFDGSIYKPTSEDEIKAMLHLAVDEYADIRNMPHVVLHISELNDVLAKLKAVCTIANIPKPDALQFKEYQCRPEERNYLDDDGEETYDHLIPFRNGLYNVQSGKLLKFTPCIFITHKLRVRYHPEYKDTNGAEDVMIRMVPDEKTRECLYRMIGYTIYSQRITGKDAALFILYGSGGNGKGTLEKIMTKILGGDYVSNLDLSQVTAKFTSNLLDNAIVNFCSDASSKSSSETHIDSGTLKALATGEPVTVQKKNEKPYKMYNNAKLWFMANCQPDLGSVDGGILRRLHIIHMLHEFTANDGIQDILYAPEAIEWMAGRCLEAYEEFLSVGSNFMDSQAMINERGYYALSNNAYDFLNSVYTLDKEKLLGMFNGLTCREIYSQYSIYCVECGVKAMPAKDFYDVLRTDFKIGKLKKDTLQPDGIRKTSHEYFVSVAEEETVKARRAKAKAKERAEEKAQAEKAKRAAEGVLA